MYNLIFKKKKDMTSIGFIMGLMFLIPLDFLNVFSVIFIFGITVLISLNCLKNIYYIEGMTTINY